jgi:hypothetical protein
VVPGAPGWGLGGACTENRSSVDSDCISLVGTGESCAASRVGARKGLESSLSRQVPSFAKTFARLS